MFKTSRQIILIAVCISIISCTKFLDTKPQDFYTPESFYETESQLNSALATIYSPLGESALYRQNVVINGFDADDGFHEDQTFNDFGPSVFNVPATDAKVASFWRTCYIGINRANLLLENLAKPDMDETRRKYIKGEALFLRAYYYFLLVQNFGDVPLQLEATKDGSNTKLKRTPAKEVYLQIIKDMEEAEKLVNNIAAIGHAGRVSKSAVRVILARVNLHMAGYPVKDESRYADVKKWCSVVMDEGYHQLNASYETVFKNLSEDKYDIRESIWEVEFYGNTQEMWRESGAIGTYAGIEYSGGDPNHGFSYGSLLSSGALWLKYPNEDLRYSYDLRRDIAIAPYDLTGNPVQKVYHLPTKKVGRDCGKYRREYEVVLPKENNYSPINYPLARFSDVLLMFAEAENQINGPTPAAVEAVNRVRRRGYGKMLNGSATASESIATIQITGAGSGYKAVPLVTISGGDGTATATAALTSGRVTAITITNPGKMFSNTPTITLVDTAAVAATTAATAVATLTPVNSADLLPADYVNKTVFLTTLQDERSRELCFEGLRKGDLIRWGIFLESMKNVLLEHLAMAPTTTAFAVPYQNVSARDVLWPIPSYEMGLNTELVQNPGW